VHSAERVRFGASVGLAGVALQATSARANTRATVSCIHCRFSMALIVPHSGQNSIPNGEPALGQRCGIITVRGGPVHVYEQSSTAVLANDKLHFRLSLAHARYTLSPHEGDLPCLEARADAAYKVGQRERAGPPASPAGSTPQSATFMAPDRAEFELVPTTGSSAVSSCGCTSGHLRWCARLPTALCSPSP
jgi:hypothetical protein